jgi:hypothetical protein
LFLSSRAGCLLLYLQMHKQAAEQQAQQQQADEADKAYTAMEELLGKAAAKAWKAARDASQGTGTAAACNIDPAATIDAASTASSSSASRNSSSKHLEVTGAAAEPKHVDSFGRSISIGSTCSSTSADNPPATAAADNHTSSAGPSSSAPTPRAAAATAAAAAAGLLAAAASAANPAESLKLQLAALGVQDPANVSRRLLEEVGQRADLDWLLASVAACLEAKGMPKRLSKKSSMKITQELNKR